MDSIKFLFSKEENDWITNLTSGEEFTCRVKVLQLDKLYNRVVFGEVFENDEIAVTHQFMSFKNGNEAVLCAWSIKDGKIIRCETGATPISS